MKSKIEFEAPDAVELLELRLALEKTVARYRDRCPGVCRICGCTENTPCEHADGRPCSWFEEDLTLCSCCEEEFNEIAEALRASVERKP